MNVPCKRNKVNNKHEAEEANKSLWFSSPSRRPAVPQFVMYPYFEKAIPDSLKLALGLAAPWGAHGDKRQWTPPHFFRRRYPQIRTQLQSFALWRMWMFLWAKTVLCR